MINELTALFLNEEPAEVLITLRRKKRVCAEDLCRSMGATEEYAVSLLQDMKETGLVKGKEDGEYILTPAGKSLSESLLQFQDLADRVNYGNHGRLTGPDGMSAEGVM